MTRFFSLLMCFTICVHLLLSHVCLLISLYFLHCKHFFFHASIPNKMRKKTAMASCWLFSIDLSLIDKNIEWEEDNCRNLDWKTNDIGLRLISRQFWIVLLVFGIENRPAIRIGGLHRYESQDEHESLSMPSEFGIRSADHFDEGSFFDMRWLRWRHLFPFIWFILLHTSWNLFTPSLHTSEANTIFHSWFHKFSQQFTEMFPTLIRFYNFRCDCQKNNK